ncbi:hypothetical protein GCM10010470_30190 [Saccharopolyspora taberi]|uniref:CBM-cenC domain-containing protein n=1 Tax=Saccharopolyspora taberi TaxID=60895 RepID=A0ABN3VD20_9PSEU
MEWRPGQAVTPSFNRMRRRPYERLSFQADDPTFVTANAAMVASASSVNKLNWKASSDALPVGHGGGRAVNQGGSVVRNQRLLSTTGFGTCQKLSPAVDAKYDLQDGQKYRFHICLKSHDGRYEHCDEATWVA